MSGRATAFDRVVMVDWSANNGPKRGKDSIWVAVGDRAGTVQATNHPTRPAAHAAVTALLDEALRDGTRVLVGYDFGFGYPAGFAPTFPGPRGPWENLWAYLEQVVTDTNTNVNNRFQVAETLNARHRAALFWGVPQPLPALSPRRKEPPQGLSDNPFAAFRVTELAASSQCGKTIKSVWQLYGGVSVGSQVLTGLPYLERLRRRYATQLAVWPQGTGFVDDPLVGRPESMILLVEIWPTAFVPTYVDGAGERDEQQVSWAVRACFRQQATGGMAQWFNPASVRKLAPAEVDVVRQEEGWILCVE